MSGFNRLERDQGLCLFKSKMHTLLLFNTPEIGICLKFTAELGTCFPLSVAYTIMGHPVGSHIVSLLRCGPEAKPESFQKSAQPLTSQNLKIHLRKDLVRPSQMALVVKNPPVNAGFTRDVGSIPGSGRSPGVGSGNPL